MRTKGKTAKETALRTADLRQMLLDRRGEIQDRVRGAIREQRLARHHDVGDDLDRSDAHVQGDMDFTLLQMRAGTLERIDAAMARLDAGTYGQCLECGSEIASRRLRALPFAARCQACEQRREQAHDRDERLALRRGRLPLFSDAVGS